MYKKLHVLLTVGAIVAVVALFAGHATATPITVLNNSFESNVVGDGASTTTISNWSKELPDTHLVTYNPTSADFPGAGGNNALPSPADGSQCAYNNSTVPDAISFYNAKKNDTFLLDAGTTYTVTVAVGQGLALHGGTFGGISLGFYDLSGAGEVAGNTTLSGAPAPGSFEDFSISFNSDDIIDNENVFAGDSMAVRITLQEQTYVDNVRIDASPTAVPEPSAFVLLGIGAVSLLTYAGRRRRRTA